MQDIQEVGHMVSSVNDPPRPEDLKLFTPAEVYHLIDARLTEVDEKISELPMMVKQILAQERSERRKRILKWLHRYIPAGGYASLLGFVVELII
jgi:hypothetical protein